MSDAMHIRSEPEQLLVRLAPPRPTDEEVAAIAARARTLQAPPPISPRVAMSITAITAVATVALAMLIIGRPTTPDAPLPGVTSQHSYFRTAKTFVPRDTFTDENFGRLTPADLEKEYGIRLAFPAQAAGGSYQGIYEEGEVGVHRYYYAIYSNDVIIQLTVLPDPGDAEEWLRGFIEGDFGLHATKVDLRGAQAFAMPRLNETLPMDPQTGGRVAGPGNGAAKVFWRQGRFVMQVMNPDANVEVLAAVARDVTFELNPDLAR
ncbi:MAG: hypothetical protein Q8K99_03000 [Actinomycetota bacterium]|nr:hypothetical protein [Actinomycetota bacterium]